MWGVLLKLRGTRFLFDMDPDYMPDHNTRAPSQEAMSPETLVERLTWRYAVKQFDSSRHIPAETWQAIEQSLVLAPSSFGLQPWRFHVITDPQLKQKLPPVSWHQTQPIDCSHFVVLTALKSLDAEYVDRFMQSVSSTRGVPLESLSGYRNVIMGTVNQTVGQHLQWNSRQLYIALGQLMAAAAMVGVDSCPMEGIDRAGYDQLLGLEESNYTTMVACALGYRSANDKYASAPKVRFPASEMIQHHR